MELNQLIQGAKEGDRGTFLSMKKEYYPQVLAIAEEVLKEREEAELSADLTLRNVYKLLGSGVNPGVLEPWMAWLAREDALEILRRRRELIRQERLLEQGNLLDTFEELDPSVYFADAQEWKLLEEAREEEKKTDMPASSPEETEQKKEKTPEEPAPEEKQEEKAPVPAAEHAAETKEQPEDKRDKKTKKGKRILLTILLLIIVLFLIWIIFGLVRSNLGLQDVLPDLGYWWVNDTIYPLFGMTVKG